MAPVPRSKNRSVIPEEWQPQLRHREYAESLGVDWSVQAERFVDHHAMHGSLMASWDAAWRTWCRNCVSRGEATGQRAMPLLSVVPHRPAPMAIDHTDPYGARAWTLSLADIDVARFDGELRPALNGYDAAGAAIAICRAAGLPHSWRGDLNIVADWLRDDISPDHAVATIGRMRKPPDLRSLRYFDGAVRERRATA